MRILFEGPKNYISGLSANTRYSGVDLGFRKRSSLTSQQWVWLLKFKGLYIEKIIFYHILTVLCISNFQNFRDGYSICS